MKKLIFALILCMGMSQVSAQENGTISLTVTGFENTDGNIEIGVYNSSSTFTNYGSEFQGASLKPTSEGTLTHVFKDIPNGTYAIAVWHDKNGNKKIDKNLFGAPKENYGFSNNIYGTFGPPAFDKVSFTVNSGKVIELEINLE